MKKYKMEINGDKYTAHIVEYKGTSAIVEVNGIEYKVMLELDKPKKVQLVRPQRSQPEMPVTSSKSVTSSGRAGEVVAPIPGLVLKVLVKEGDVVKQDQPVIMLEAMKMESEITSTVTGTIKKIHVKEGESVQERQLLMEVEG